VIRPFPIREMEGVAAGVCRWIQSDSKEGSMKKLVLSFVAVLAASAIAVAVSSGSSHREAPGSSLDPTGDWTDVYFFTPNDHPNKAVVIGNVIPFEDPAGGPLFYSLDPNAHYYLNFDNTGDGRYDIRYRFTIHDKIDQRTRLALGQSGQVTSVDDPDLLLRQTYDVTRLEYDRHGHLTDSDRVGSNLPVAPSNIGPKTMPDYQSLVDQSVRSLDGGGKVFVGQRDDPFFIDLGVTFDLINFRDNTTGNAGGYKDDLAGYAVHSFVLELPDDSLLPQGNAVHKNKRHGHGKHGHHNGHGKGHGHGNAHKGHSHGHKGKHGQGSKHEHGNRHRGVANGSAPAPVVGVWASTERRKLQVSGGRDRSGHGPWVQVNRLGNPLINELFVPISRKDEFNRTPPSEDGKRFGQYALEPELVKAINGLFNLGCPETNRTDIVQALFTGIPGLTQIGDHPAAADTLKLNLGVPPTDPSQASRFGVIGGDLAGLPDGRRLSDDAVDIYLRVACGFLVPESQGGKKLPLGDGVDANDKPFLSSFPYAAAPTSGFDSQIKKTQPTHAPTPGTPPLVP
jgi:hypothetical protein